MRLSWAAPTNYESHDNDRDNDSPSVLPPRARDAVDRTAKLKDGTLESLVDAIDG